MTPKQLGMGLVLSAAVAFALGIRVSAQASNMQSTSNSGPVAIGVAQASSAFVLQGDGQVMTFDTAKAAAGSRVYRVPRSFFATDLAAAPFEGASILCLTVNGRAAREYESFLLQVLPGGREIWTWMPRRGVYIGVAVDPMTSQAYVTNSTNNAIYRVALGGQKTSPIEIAHLNQAERIGSLAVDLVGRRLYVADMAQSVIHVVPLEGSGSSSRIDLPGAEEIRAVAWSASAKRLYVADSSQEVVWVVDPERRASFVQIRDQRLQSPAGLAVSPDGVWMVDEGAKAVFRIADTFNAFSRVVPWSPPPVIPLPNAR